MKRYRLEYIGNDFVDDDSINAIHVEDNGGDWVKFEDIEKEKFSSIANAIIIIAADLEKKRLKAPVCNCKHYAEIGRLNGFSPMANRYWICPAHGYKKI